jgi:hypothetical protein
MLSYPVFYIREESLTDLLVEGLMREQEQLRTTEIQSEKKIHLSPEDEKWLSSLEKLIEKTMEKNIPSNMVSSCDCCENNKPWQFVDGRHARRHRSRYKWDPYKPVNTQQK